MLAALLPGCGSGGDDVDNPPAATITDVEWHLAGANSDQLVYSAAAGPSFVYLWVTVRRSDGSSRTEYAVGNSPTPQYCQFTPGDLLGVGPPIAYQVQLKGDINAAHLSGNSVVPAPPPGASPYAILLHIDQGNVPPFQPIVEVTSSGFAPVSWTVSVSP
jgi:hypothetical protein